MNDLARNICRIVGHDLRINPFNSPSDMTYILDGSCDRCLERHTSKVKYVDLYTRRFAPFERAKEKILEAFEKREAKRKDL